MEEKQAGESSGMRFRSPPGREWEVARLFDTFVDHRLWSLWQIPRKIKTFRSGGRLHMLEGELFSGYLFVRTPCPRELMERLNASREFPRFFMAEKEVFVPLEAEDLLFLQNVCGERLERPMGVSEIAVGEKKEILRVKGALEPYVSRIVRLNLHKRFAVAEISLFNRKQQILFGIKLEQDLAV